MKLTKFFLFVLPFVAGLVIGVTGSAHVHDVRDTPHEVERGQPIEPFENFPPDTGFTVYDGEMILVVDGERVLTFYRDDLAEVCNDVE